MAGRPKRAPRVLVLGYGNPGRQDDGLGPAAAARIEALGLPNVTVEADYQLNIEDGAALAGHDVALFVDASRDAPAPYAIEEVAHDRAVSFFFSVDYELYSEVERTILRFLADQLGASLAEIDRHTQDSSDAVTIGLSALHELGIVSRDRDGRYEIASLFLRRWLAEGAAIPPNDVGDSF